MRERSPDVAPTPTRLIDLARTSSAPPVTRTLASPPSAADAEVLEGLERDLHPEADGPYARVVKPAFDRAAAAVLLLLALPVLALTALVVYVSLGGPVLFRQQRIGRGGVPFTVYKFRTMHPDRRGAREGYDGPERRRTHKHPDDPRLTPTGRIIRTLSLDELPQLLNVLKGDMSLVGPRPEIPAIVERYEWWQHRRHAVTPGMTGLWQVSLRGEGEMHEHVEADLEYVDSLSLRTDLGILLRTVPAVLASRRGY